MKNSQGKLKKYTDEEFKNNFVCDFEKDWINDIYGISDDSKDSENPIRRIKRYIFCQFKDLPLPKSSAIKNIICQVLMQATYVFVKEAVDKVKE